MGSSGSTSGLARTCTPTESKRPRTQATRDLRGDAATDSPVPGPPGWLRLDLRALPSGPSSRLIAAVWTRHFAALFGLWQQRLDSRAHAFYFPKGTAQGVKASGSHLIRATRS